METSFKFIALCSLLLATAATSPAQADDYPNKPIRIISDSAPGSAVDVTFRIVMDRLGTVLGQQIVPVDTPGASGAIAAHAASDAIPDGYTLFAPAISLFIALPGKAENLPLMLPRDFLPVASLIDQPMFICASAASGIKTLPDLIARAKQNPNQISFAATGIGRITHLTGLLLQSRADIKLQVVPYTGGPAAALTDVVGGRVPLIIEGYSGLAGAIQAHTLPCWQSHRRIAYAISRCADGSGDAAGFCRRRMARHCGAARNAGGGHPEGQCRSAKGARRTGHRQSAGAARRLCQSDVSAPGQRLHQRPASAMASGARGVHGQC